MIIILYSFHLYAVNIAITIDDHPMENTSLFSTKQRTDKLIEACKKHNVKAVFFCVGAHYITNDQDSLSLLVQNGHFLANHSFTHEHLSKYSIDRFQKEITVTEQILNRFGGAKWFRYPFLDYGNRKEIGGSQEKKIQSYELLKKLGYTEGYVTIPTWDWYINSKLKLAAQNKRTIDWDGLKKLYLSLVKEWCSYYIDLYNKNGINITHTLLLHANDLNGLYLDDMLTMIKDSGWHLVSPDRAFNNATWLDDAINNKMPFLLDKPKSLDSLFIDNLLEKASIF